MTKQKSTLTFDKINKIQKKYSETFLFEYSDGESVLVSEVFRPSLIEDLLEEYGTLINLFDQENDEEISEKFKLYFLYFLILKYFTDLGKDVSNDPSLLIQQFHNIVDSIYLSELINEGFPKEEVSKVFDKATEVTATYSFLGNLTSQLNEQFEELNLQNKNVLANIGNNAQSE